MAVTVIAGFCLTATGSAWAQVYRCQNGGKTSYQALPCSKSEQTVELTRLKAPPRSPWDGLRRGVSVQTIRARFPTQKFETDDDGKGLKIPELHIAGMRYIATYKFDPNGFQQFNAVSGSSLPNEEIKETFSRTADEISELYGPEARYALKLESEGLKGEAEWIVPTGRVVMEVRPTTETLASITVSFYP